MTNKNTKNRRISLEKLNDKIYFVVNNISTVEVLQFFPTGMHIKLEHIFGESEQSDAYISKKDFEMYPTIACITNSLTENNEHFTILDFRFTVNSTYNLTLQIDDDNELIVGFNLKQDYRNFINLFLNYLDYDGEKLCNDLTENFGTLLVVNPSSEIIEYFKNFNDYMEYNVKNHGVEWKIKK